MQGKGLECVRLGKAEGSGEHLLDHRPWPGIQVAEAPLDTFQVSPSSGVAPDSITWPRSSH